jgi:predicted metal-dependent peptidase
LSEKKNVRAYYNPELNHKLPKRAQRTLLAHSITVYDNEKIKILLTQQDGESELENKQACQQSFIINQRPRTIK